MSQYFDPTELLAAMVFERLRAQVLFNSLSDRPDPPPDKDISGSWDGLHLDVAPCANVRSASVEGCTKRGAQQCSKCHLVRYCSKECQVEHWQTHKSDCCSSYLKDSWRPDWVKEDRSPSFMTNGPAEQTHFGSGMGLHLWGNVPAFSILTHPGNHKDRVRSTDNLKLCFAASGDIRNLVKTVNSLPGDYTGKCHILFNDHNPIMMIRNTILLSIFEDLEPDLAAEVAVHVMYSAFLTPRIRKELRGVWGRLVGDDDLSSCSGMNKIRYTLESGTYSFMRAMYTSSYSTDIARESMNNSMNHPCRIDYVHRYLSCLRPGHRLSTMRHRQSGILAPFSADTSGFIYPNRTLFKPNGEWLLADNSSPLAGWDLNDAQISGRKNGYTEGDIFGSLGIHLKAEFREFGRRLQEMKVTIHLQEQHAEELCKRLLSGEHPPFGATCFDRIEVSNLADYSGIRQLLEDWGPLLKKSQSQSTLVMYFMNWVMKEKESSFSSDPKAIIGNESLCERSFALLGLDKKSVRGRLLGLRESEYLTTCMLRVIDVFFDNDRAFQRFLRKEAIQETTKRLGLIVRSANRIHTKRIGVPISRQSKNLPEVSHDEHYFTFLLGHVEHTIRFVEIERS